jgi:hypothetical protein
VADTGVPGNVTFERTRDLALVRGILTHPAIWPHITDDGSPSIEDFEPADPEAVIYLVARDGADLLGLWMAVPRNAVELEVHTCLLPVTWGPRAAIAGREAIEWVWANTRARRIVTSVPEPNRLAHRFAQRTGMTEYGRDPLSFLRGGELFDQILLGISRPEGKQENTCQQRQY